MALQSIINTQPHSIHLFARHPLQNVPHYEGLISRAIAWMLSFFDYTLHIHDATHHTHFYMRTRDIVSALCSIPGHLPSTSAKIHRLVLENINPIIGKNPTLETITRFFSDFRSAQFVQLLQSLESDEQIKNLLVKRLEAFKNRHLTTISWNDMESRLKPGDIIFRNLVENPSNVLLGQQFLAPTIRGKKERQGYQFSHVSIYLGQGKIAEAISDSRFGTRIFDIHDPQFTLKPLSKTRYVVTRFHDPRIAHQAAQIAAELATDDNSDHAKPNTQKYSYLLAGAAALSPPNFGPVARYHYLTQYIDDHEHRPPMEYSYPKGFFCSYFVGYCYQTAESRVIMPRILPQDNAGPAHSSSHFGNAFLRRLWAFLASLRLGNAMNDHVELTFHAKRTTPNELRNFVVTKPRLFTDLYFIKPSA